MYFVKLVIQAKYSQCILPDMTQEITNKYNLNDAVNATISYQPTIKYINNNWSPLTRYG